jgi:hypothetical protein
MLTRAGAGRDQRRRGPARLAAVAPTVRVAKPGLIAVTVALAAVPTLVTLALDGTSYLAPSILAGVVTGAALGWAADDPAAELLGTLPTGSPVRALIRAATALVVGATGLTLLIVLVALGPGLPADVGDRLPEAVAAGTVALAVGMVAARRGERGAGAGAVTAGVIATPFVAAMSVKITALPSFTSGPHHDRWWLLALAAAAVAVFAGRDPGRP